MKKQLFYFFALMAIVTNLSAAVDNDSSCCEKRFHVRADYLYWWTCVDDLAFAAEVKADQEDLYNPQSNILFPNPPLNAVTAEIFKFKDLQDKKIVRPSNSGHSGFRVGLGYDLACDRTLVLNWTSFCPNISKKLESNDATSMSHFFIPFSGFAFDDAFRATYFGKDSIFVSNLTLSGKEILRASKIAGKWHLDLDDIDFGVRQEFKCGNCFSVAPHLDLRYVSNKQRVRIDTVGSLLILSPLSGGGTNSELTIIGPFIVESTFKTEYCGLGPQVGLDLDFGFGCNWDLFGKLSTSLIYGEECHSVADRVLEIIRLVGDILTAEDLQFKQHSDQHCVRPIIDLALGVSYAYNTCCYGRDLALNFDLAWEYHHFFNQGLGQLQRDRDFCTSEHPDLSTQGITVCVSAMF